VKWVGTSLGNVCLAWLCSSWHDNIYQTEFERVCQAVGKYKDLTFEPNKPAEQQLEDYHNWVGKIRKAGKIQMDAENLVGSDNDDD
jgi:hypothetical protein